MRHRIVPIANVSRLSDAGNALRDRAPGMPGIGLVWGPTGYGKTTAASWYINQVHGVYVRALALWTPATMLGAILRELDHAPRGSNAQHVEDIVRELAQSGRPLFIDEADYLIERKLLVETLRDLHDLSTVPVILIGMADIKHKIGRRQQLSGRVAQEVEFKPAELRDTRMLASALAQVEIGDELVERLHQQAKGSVRLIVVGLYRIEQYARARGMSAIDAGGLPPGFDLFTGPAPEQQSPALAPREEPAQTPRRRLAVVDHPGDTP